MGELSGEQQNSTTSFRALGGDLGFLSVIMMLGAILRLDFMRAAQFVIDSDEAIVGLMAKHMTEGSGIPVFYYGQHYMGSLEAVFAAISFLLFGISSFSLQLVPLVCSLVLIGVMYQLGYEFGGRIVARVAALLTAIPPAGFVVWSVKARGGFIEVVLLGALALLIAARWWKVGSGELRYTLMLGFVLGVGFWTNNQIIYFMGPIGLFSLLYLVSGIVDKELSLAAVALAISGGVVSFLAGGAPFWWYNIEHGFPSFGMFGVASGTEILSHIQGLFSTALPILLGAKHFWEQQSSYWGSTAITYTVYGSILCALIYSRRRAIALLCSKGRLDRVAPVELLLVFVLFSCVVFSISTFGWLVQAPRYLLPIYVGLFVLCGYVVKRVSEEASTIFGVLLTALLVSLNALSAYAGGRAIPGEPVVFQGQRVSREHSELYHLLERLGITHLRTNYWIGYRIAFDTKERVTFSMFGPPYQVRISAYEDKRDPSIFNRTPILVVPAEAEALRGIFKTLRVTFRETPVSGYVLFHEINELSPARVLLLPRGAVNAQGWGSRDLYSAIDGDSSSRWGTGAPQVPGQWFRIEFRQPVRLSGISYDLAGFLHDYPRGLSISLETDTGRRWEILSPEDYQRILLYLRENRGISLFWPAENVRAITFTQTESDPIFDWSIAELYLYEPAS